MKKNQKMSKHRSKYQKKCPVQIGNEYNVDVTDIAPNGPGIARVQGFLILVHDAKIGKNKTIKITKIEQLSAEAKIVSEDSSFD
ncbi:MAG: TRAM domain-containing protein [Candidatus Bathyarchaeota archaeon]|nr:TRAM domain-containing protein [Candidatus Bathyarchaeota archaeon]